MYPAIAIMKRAFSTPIDTNGIDIIRNDFAQCVRNLQKKRQFKEFNLETPMDTRIKILKKSALSMLEGVS